MTNAKLAPDVDQRIVDLQAAVALLQARLAAVESNSALQLGGVVYTVPGILNGVSGPHVIFEGVNLHVRSGSGATNDNGVLLGLGNVIVGYNEEPHTGLDPGERGGSHNVILNQENHFLSTGGLVSGTHNFLFGTGASIVGGYNNIANGEVAAILGGNNNQAAGLRAAVSGGRQNIASGGESSICGGRENTASQWYSSVGGGLQNSAGGYNSSVSGGVGRSAPFDGNWAAGGLYEVQ